MPRASTIVPQLADLPHNNCVVRCHTANRWQPVLPLSGLSPSHPITPPLPYTPLTTHNPQPPPFLGALSPAGPTVLLLLVACSLSILPLLERLLLLFCFFRQLSPWFCCLSISRLLSVLRKYLTTQNKALPPTALLLHLPHPSLPPPPVPHAATPPGHGRIARWGVGCQCSR